MRNLARLWKASEDTSLPVAIASIFKMTPEEVEAKLREMLESVDDEKSSRQERDGWLLRGIRWVVGRWGK